jgi:protein TonB
MGNELVFIEDQPPPERLGFIIVVATASIWPSFWA